jgi:hypothetical protein
MTPHIRLSSLATTEGHCRAKPTWRMLVLGFMPLFSRKGELGPLPYQVVMTGKPRMKFTRCHMFDQSYHVVLPQGATHIYISIL